MPSSNRTLASKILLSVALVLAGTGAIWLLAEGLEEVHGVRFKNILLIFILAAGVAAFFVLGRILAIWRKE